MPVAVHAKPIGKAPLLNHSWPVEWHPRTTTPPTPPGTRFLGSMQMAQHDHRPRPLTGEDSLDGQFGYSRVAEAGGFDSADGADSFGGLDSAGFDSAGFDSADGDGGSNPGHDSALSQRRHYRKTLRPSATQLRSLGLQLGANTIEFSVHSSLQGTQIIASRLFLFESTSKLVISDVDGTITKSDVLGHLMPRVGYDWSHLGVTQPYSRIVANGYHMVYLTARGIGMAGTTRDYLKSVQQASASKAESRLARRALPPLAYWPRRVAHTRGH